MAGATMNKNSADAMPTGKGYFDAIDGLRALAVLLVLFFHARFDFATGGFVGVDVFFVISGFLITSNIVRDIERGDWSFGKFYARRAARLLPALFTVLFFTLVGAFFILSPTDLERLGRTSIYAALSGSNIFFWLEAGYFDQAADTKPLLHTWSLGVEEQFYLVWPLLVLGFYRWRARSGVLIGMIALGVISLAAALLAAPHLPSAVFFLTPFRIYQFGLGALVALGLKLAQGNKAGVAGYVAAAALFAIAYAADGETSPYWLAAVAPALAAAIFIWSAESPVIKLAFASLPMRWIGQRSYAIYLTHWPIMVLWPLATDYELSFVEGWIAIAVSVATGAILHAAVEKPLRFRSQTAPLQRQRRLALVAAMLLAVMFPAAHLWGLNGAPSRIPPRLAAYADIEALRADRNRAVSCEFPEFDAASARYQKCIAPSDSRPTFLVLGDSLGTEIAAALRLAFPRYHFSQATGGGCIVSLKQDSQIKGRTRCYRMYTDIAARSRANPAYKEIVLVSSWRKGAIEDLNGLIAYYNAAGREPIVVGPRVRFGERVPNILAASKSFAIAEKRAQSLAKYDASEAFNQVFHKELRGKYVYIDFIDMQCPDERCPIFDGQREGLYFDGIHFTAKGINWISRRIRRDHAQLFGGLAGE